MVDSTRHLYKEGSREISTNIENKDDTPYLIKSQVEASEGMKETAFYGDSPLFRPGGQANQHGTYFP